MLKVNLVLCHLLGGKTKGECVSWEGADVKLRNGLNKKASVIETEAEGKTQAADLPGAPSPCKGCLPRSRASLPITTVALPPPWTFHDFLALLLHPFRNPTAFTPDTCNPVFSVYTPMCGYVQSPEDTLGCHFSGAVHFILFESASRCPGTCKLGQAGW